MNDHDLAEHRLRSLRRWVDDLHWYVKVADAQNLSELDERNREAFPYEWDDVVDRTRTLTKHAEAGLLQPASLETLRGIVIELAELVPTLQRLRLRIPDLDALARAAGSPAESRPH